MDDHSQVLDRVENALGPVATTMFTERGRDRHFILEITLTGVALYLLSKYVDGFIEGLGISDLGKKHGQAVREAAQFGFDTFTGKHTPEKQKLGQRARSVSIAIAELHEFRTDHKGLASGHAKLLLLLQEPGIPKAEAERISKDLEAAIWKP